MIVTVITSLITALVVCYGLIFIASHRWKP